MESSRQRGATLPLERLQKSCSLAMQVSRNLFGEAQPVICLSNLFHTSLSSQPWPNPSTYMFTSHIDKEPCFEMERNHLDMPGVEIVRCKQLKARTNAANRYDVI